jgi:hypothetical protein
VSGRVANRQAQKNAPQEPQVQYVEVPAEAPAAAAAPADDYTAELEKLADLHSKGILTDEEFTAKKSQLLGL